MRISDGSSDVCSSDLPANMPELGRHRGAGLVNAIQHPAPAPERGLATKVGNEIDSARIRPVNTATLGNEDRKSVVEGKRVSVRVDLGGSRRHIKKHKTETQRHKITNK